MEIIAISTTSFGEYDKSPLKLLESKGYKVLLNPYRLKIKSEKLVDFARDAVGLIAGTETIEERTISKLPKLKAISRCGAGLDNVDLQAAKRFNIKVINTPDAPTIAVAELTLGLILNLLRKVNTMDSLIRRGEWQKLMGNLLYRKKVGIIGCGRIGQKVADLLKSFGCEIAYHDPEIKERKIGFESMSLERLIQWADIVTIHASGKSVILGDKEFRSMRKGSWLINVSRGGLVDEAALYSALQNKHISGAAIDVFTQEPYKGLLTELNSVILTPHIGSYAMESRVAMEMEAAKNLLKLLNNEEV